jgi:hypothetical protein
MEPKFHYRALWYYPSICDFNIYFHKPLLFVRYYIGPILMHETLKIYILSFHRSFEQIRRFSQCPQANVG